jgi:type I site-specific restriction endonuclease
MLTLEELARRKIDNLLKDCGWIIQERSEINLSAARGIAISEGLLKGGDDVDHLLFVEGKAIATIEAAAFRVRKHRRKSGCTKRQLYKNTY